VKETKIIKRIIGAAVLKKKVADSSHVKEEFSYVSRLMKKMHTCILSSRSFTPRKKKSLNAV
jgi:hypothetical protein